MKVLLALDASSGSHHVIEEVVRRPWRAGTTFLVLSVVDLPRWKGMPMLIEDAKVAARSAVNGATAEIGALGCEISTEVAIGFPKKVIPDFAKDWNAELVMVGSRGHGTLARLLLGSVAQAVVRSANCSVEIVRLANHPVTESRMIKILLATDGSDSSAKAVSSVADRLWPAGSELKIISVRELLVLENQVTASPSCPVYPESLLDEIMGDACKRAESAVSEARGSLSSSGLHVVEGCETPVGDPRAILLDEASAWGADLIVLGSRGRHGFDRMLLGSVSESIAMHAHCSVEVVR